MIQTVGIIGSGNVAWHLIHGLLATQVKISWVYGRNEQTLKEIKESAGVSVVTALPAESVDLILVCVNDDAIQSVLNQLPSNSAVAYTSGTVALDKLQFSQTNCGVFYPLQTFTRKKEVALQMIPFLIEATNELFAKELEALAATMSSNVQRMNSDERKQLHVAAVMVNNFTNHLMYLAEEHLAKNQLDKQLLYPLVQETVNKAMQVGPFIAQSGPARRNDLQTIHAHEESLDGTTKEIYQALTQSIINTYKK